MLHFLAIAAVALTATAAQPAKPLAITDPAALARLESEGLAFEKIVARSGNVDVASILTNSIRDALSDLSERIKAIRKTGYLGKAKGFPLREIDAVESNFALIAVVDRSDRGLLAAKTCGETRLIYRLRTPLGARPMTINLAFEAPRPPNGSCKAAVIQALDPQIFRRPFDRLEVNVLLATLSQDVTQHFLDQSHYLLGTFRLKGGKLVPEALENTPDVERIKADPSLRRRLLAWIRAPENAAPIAAGRHHLPEEFLATTSVSVTPLGDHRLANRPFASLFGRAPTIDRLDDATCSGCHQASSLAGFHALGTARADDAAFDRLKDGFSAHFNGIQASRAASRAALAAGTSPPPVPNPRFSSEKSAMCDRGQLHADPRPELDYWTDFPAGACKGDCQVTQQGFPGGICSALCDRSDEEFVCVTTPRRGLFASCVEQGGTRDSCLATNGERRALARCHSSQDCREEYACVAGSGDEGYCAPTYFLRQLTLP